MKHSSQAFIYAKHGEPAEVLTLKTLEVPQVLGADEVLIGLIGASINPSDMGMINGSYGRLKTLPAVGGREGVAKVLEVGVNVKKVKVGGWVRFPEDLGVLQEYVVVKEDAVANMILPEGISPEMASMAFINAQTAWRLLHDFVRLQPGDWIIQNAANSAVGIFVIQLARFLGLKTINIVRNAKKREEVLKKFGANVVLDDSSDWLKEIHNLNGSVRPKLGLNSVGGESVLKIIKTLENNGTVVTFGGMVTEPIRFPTRYFIFHNIQLVGFWYDRWMRQQSAKDLHDFNHTLFGLMNKGVFKPVVEKVYDFGGAIEAFKHASNDSRMGKILIAGPCWPTSHA
jgi:trans-2-enoyl-CoA reductase